MPGRAGVACWRRDHHRHMDRRVAAGTRADLARGLRRTAAAHRGRSDLSRSIAAEPSRHPGKPVEPPAGAAQRKSTMNPDTFASDLLGYAAAGLVLLTFLAQSMGTLRVVAIASNVMFIGYALLADVTPVLLLHVLLLPLNAWRLWQASRTPAPTPARIEPTLPSLAPTLAAFRAGTPPVTPPNVRRTTI